MERIIPIPDLFLEEPNLALLYSINDLEKLQVTQFIEAYYHNPSQYGYKKPFDLIHHGWVRRSEDTLKLASKMGSIQFYQFIIDMGCFDGQERIPNNTQFLDHCFSQKRLSYTFTIYLLELCPNRINLIPPNILLYILVFNDYVSFGDVLQLFWDRCDQLKSQKFLNSEIKMPCEAADSHNMFRAIGRCITDGGYDGDLSSWELKDKYKISFCDGNVYPINFLISKKGSIPVLRFIIENSNISLTPIYHSINLVSDSQDGLLLLDNIFDSIEPIFHIPRTKFKPSSAENIIWYLNWWKNNVLGDKVSLHQFKTFIYGLFWKPKSEYWTMSCPLVQYLGDDFFTTLSTDQILSFLDALVSNSVIDFDLRCDDGPDNTFLLANAFISITSIANTIKDCYCVNLTRAFLFRLCRWDCAEVFLKFGGLTMEHIWSVNHDCESDDSNDEKDNRAGNCAIFTMKTLISSPVNKNRFILPVDLMNWLSYQPGTQEQIIKIVQSKLPSICREWTNITESLRRLFLFIDFTYNQRYRREFLFKSQQQLYPLHQRFILQLSPPPSPILQSMSWLQLLFVYAPIDYMNVKLTIKLWKNRSDGTLPYITLFSSIVGEETQIGLCHLPILIDRTGSYNTPVLLLEDIINGVIEALLINHQC